MPNEPNEYLMLTNLQTALQGITGSGYHYPVTAAAVKFDIDHDVEALIEPDGPRPFIVIDASEAERWELIEKPNGLRLMRPVRIHWVHRFAPSADTARLQMFLRGCADVEKAIVPDPSRGGYASDTRIVNRSWNQEADGLVVWAFIDVQLMARRTYGEPNV